MNSTILDSYKESAILTELAKAADKYFDDRGDSHFVFNSEEGKVAVLFAIEGIQKPELKNSIAEFVELAERYRTTTLSDFENSQEYQDADREFMSALSSIANASDVIGEKLKENGLPIFFNFQELDSFSFDMLTNNFESILNEIRIDVMQDVSKEKELPKFSVHETIADKLTEKQLNDIEQQLAAFIEENEGLTINFKHASAKVLIPLVMELNGNEQKIALIRNFLIDMNSGYEYPEKAEYLNQSTSELDQERYEAAVIQHDGKAKEAYESIETARDKLLDLGYIYQRFESIDPQVFDAIVSAMASLNLYTKQEVAQDVSKETFLLHQEEGLKLTVDLSKAQTDKIDGIVDQLKGIQNKGLEYLTTKHTAFEVDMSVDSEWSETNWNETFSAARKEDDLKSRDHKITPEYSPLQGGLELENISGVEHEVVKISDMISRFQDKQVFMPKELDQNFTILPSELNKFSDKLSKVQIVMVAEQAKEVALSDTKKQNPWEGGEDRKRENSIGR